MADRDDEGTDETVDAAMDDADGASAPVKTYECADCGNRVEARHQPGECQVCGGEMVDISVSRE